MKPRDMDASRSRPRANGQPPPSPAAPPDPDERWTVGRLLTWTADFLKRRGAESPRLDAEVLLADVLGWERVQLYTHFEEEVGERPRGAFRDLVRRRAEGMPVAYLVGRKEFYSLPLARLARRADPPARLGVRGRRVPGPDQGARRPPRRRRRDRLGLPGPGLSPPAQVGAVRGDRPEPRGAGRGRVEREGARPGRSRRVPPGEPARARSPATAPST